VIRRLFWFGTGASIGLGGAMWVRRRIRQAVARYVPARVRRDVADGVRRVGSELKGAWSEGRSAMQTREAELRRELAPGERRR
jgi:hypothetical protein